MRALPSLILEPRPSRILLISGGGAHVLSGVAVVVCSFPLWIKVGLIAGIALALVRFGWQYGYWRGRGFIARLELLDGRWQLETGDGNQHRAWLMGSYAHPHIVILNFRLESSERRSLALLPDATEAETLRRLRVWLRIQRGADTPDHP